MVEQEILTLLLSGIFLIAGVLTALSTLNFKTLIVLILMALSGLFMVITVKETSYNKGQIDALKKIQKYEMIIHYEWKDSTYVVADTTYIIRAYTIDPIANKH